MLGIVPSYARALRRTLLAVGLAAAALPQAPLRAAGGGKSAGPEVVIQYMDLEPGAVGTARMRWSSRGTSGSDFNVRLDGVPDGTYSLHVGDINSVAKSTISISGGGGEFDFTVPLADGRPLLDFGVDGETFFIAQVDVVPTLWADGTLDSTSTPFSTDNGDRTKASSRFVNVGPDIGARGRVEFFRRSYGTFFRFEAEGLDAGSHTLSVDGVPVADFLSNGRDLVEIEFEAPLERGKTLLNFDPLGATLEVEGDAGVLLRTILPAPKSVTGVTAPGRPRDFDFGVDSDGMRVDLANMGALAGVEGTASWVRKSRTEFQLVVEGAPAGSYPVCVDGAQVGLVTIAEPTPPATKLLPGTITFVTSPGASELLLDFAVLGKRIDVKYGSATMLSTIFPVSSLAALGKHSRERHRDNKRDVNLYGTGFDFDAAGEMTLRTYANWEERLDIDVEDLAPGTYSVVSGSFPSATPLIVGATGRGKLRLGSPPSSSRALLDFSVLDFVIQIVDANDNVVLEGLFSSL